MLNLLERAMFQVGSLGLPGTQWADGEVLDAKIQAQGLSALLWELMERGELCLRPPVCVVLLGLGPGANAMLNFAGTFLVDEKFTPLRDSTRFVVVVNPFPAAPDTSPEIQQVKRQLQTLKRTLQRGAHHEQLQSLIMAMFSAEYVEKVSWVQYLLQVPPYRCSCYEKRPALNPGYTKLAENYNDAYVFDHVQ